MSQCNVLENNPKENRKGNKRVEPQVSELLMEEEREQEVDDDFNKQHPTTNMRKSIHPSLFVVKGILESVYKGSAFSHKAKFSELAFATPELRNREKLGEYLKLLVNDLGWLEVKEEMKRSPYNPRRTRAIAEWMEYYYFLTDSGRTFLSLFLPSFGEESEEEEEQKNPDQKKMSPVLKRPRLYTIKAILDEAKGGVFNYSDLTKVAKGASNRRNLSAYLKLLCDELGWLEKKKRVWSETIHYDVTPKGRTFLELFLKEQVDKNRESKNQD